MVEDRYLHSLEVGDRAHRIVGTAVSEGLPADRVMRVARIAEIGQQVFQAHPVSVRPREARFQAVTAAGVYVHRFMPVGDWALLGVEMRDGRSRFDLVFQSADGTVVIDELKLGVGRAGENYVRKQIDRYVDLGLARWGAKFAGVRMCCVHEPNTSRWVVPGRMRSALLAESKLPQGLGIR